MHLLFLYMHLDHVENVQYQQITQIYVEEIIFYIDIDPVFYLMEIKILMFEMPYAMIKRKNKIEERIFLLLLIYL
jgi:hypothetical protein